jgi:hypothetical protein
MGNKKELFKKLKKDEVLRAQMGTTILISETISYLTRKTIEENPKPNNEEYTKEEIKLVYSSIVKENKDILKAFIHTLLTQVFDVKDLSKFEVDLDNPKIVTPNEMVDEILD